MAAGSLRQASTTAQAIPLIAAPLPTPSELPTASDPPLWRATAGSSEVSFSVHGPTDPAKAAAWGGDVPNILCIHGGPGSVFDWRYIGPQLEESCRVFRLELPGHANTPLEALWEVTEPLGVAGDDDRTRLGPQRYAAFVSWFARNVVDRFGGGELPVEITPDRLLDTSVPLPDTQLRQPVAVLGHSMGGDVAMRFTSLEPERVEVLSLLSSVGVTRHKGIRPKQVVHGMAQVLDMPLGLGESLGRSLIWHLHTRVLGFTPRMSPLESEVLLRRVRQFSFPGVRQAVETIRNSDVRVVQAWAEDDHLIEPARSEELGRALPAGPRLRFAKGGHFPNKWWSREVAEATLGELRAARGLPPAASKAKL